MMVSSCRQINKFQKDTSEYANSKFKHEKNLTKTTIFCDLTLRVHVNGLYCTLSRILTKFDRNPLNLLDIQ